MKALSTGTDEERAVTVLRALANPARFRIVKLLAELDACVCGDIVDRLPLAQSTVSEHLRVLKEAGVVQGTVEGPNSCYCLVPETLSWLRSQLNLGAPETVIQLLRAREGNGQN